MLYPIATLIDGTEITASKIHADNTFDVGIEKWNQSINDFSSFQIRFPSKNIINKYKCDDAFLNALYRHVCNLSDVIFDYINEQESKKNNKEMELD